MRALLTAVPGLGCALMMAGMMWLMARGSRRDRDVSTDQRPGDADQEAQIADLRSEVDRLRAELHRAGQSTPMDREPDQTG